MPILTMPIELQSDRLYFRRWQPEDAAQLLPILEANAEHLADWIPARVSTSVPLPELAQRLAGFADDFDAGRAWRFALFSPDRQQLLGEVDLFPRSAEGRVQVLSADRLEIGYWLRADATGMGYATEATQTMLSLANRLPGIKHVEIRCDPRNAPSAAVPRRLGFRLLNAGPDGMVAEGEDMIWILGRT